MAKCFAYIRVSTESQASEGVSLEAQQAKIAAWAMLNDYELAGNFIDAGLSGSRADNRPELQKALAAVCAEKGSALVIYSLSRLSRSTMDTLSIAARLEKAGADLVSLSEKIDTSSASGKMIFRMLSVLANFERDLVSERTKMAMNFKRSKGERIGKIPFGFNLSADGITLERNESEQEALAIIRELRNGGMSLRDIATELNRRGIVTKNQKQWIHSSVTSVLKRAA